MTQSTNARPCNCDQALEAERLLKLCQDTAADTWGTLTKKLNAEVEALNLTCAQQGRKLAAIEKILLNYAIKPNLRACSFTTQPLEAIRLAMLERPW